MRIPLACVILLSCASAVAAKSVTEKVMSVANDGTVTLAQTGKARFADILFPDPALANQWLAAHVLQKEISFTVGDPDRYGRTLIWSDSEAAMLRDGVAIVFNQEALEDSWASAEASARGAKRGVWANADLVLTPENAAQHFSEFHVVEGTVTHTYRAKSATYINFGADWHTDFSVTIAGRNRRSFDDKLARIHEGSKVRVRGTIYEENGPMIKLTRPEQLEIL